MSSTGTLVWLFLTLGFANNHDHDYYLQQGIGTKERQYGSFAWIPPCLRKSNADLIESTGNKKIRNIMKLCLNKKHAAFDYRHLAFMPSESENTREAQPSTLFLTYHLSLITLWTLGSHN